MRTLRKNKQEMRFALQIGEVPIYKTDDEGNILYDHYEDSEGNIIYFLDENGNKIPLETGDYETGYGEVQTFLGNISLSGGESVETEFGIDVSAYDAVMVTERNALPLTETSLIWFESEVGYKDNDNTIVDPDTADYKILAIKPSLNFTKYILGRLVK